MAKAAVLNIFIGTSDDISDISDAFLNRTIRFSKEFWRKYPMYCIVAVLEEKISIAKHPIVLKVLQENSGG